MSREIVYKGTNTRGNSYTAYSDGSFDYDNLDGTKYWDTGDGYAFLKQVIILVNFWLIHVVMFSNPNGSQASGGKPYTTLYNDREGVAQNTYSSSAYSTDRKKNAA